MARFARKSRIDDALLVEAIERAEKGLIDADLGGGVIKQRVGRAGQGRSGGYRTLIAIREGDRAIFVFAFAKNERDNVGPDQLLVIKELAAKALSWSNAELRKAVDDGRIEEIGDGKEEQ
jgi:hypothetical protein